jgi:PIN domain nuclease of toxin-antitoxin system
MKLLLDTCAALWWWQDSPSLSGGVRARIADTRNTIYFSAVSAMELSTKIRLGKLALSGQLARDLGTAVAASGWQELPLSINEAQQAGKFDWSHRDPFDRLLAAQSLCNKFTLVTCDSAFSTFPQIKVLW